MHEQKWLNTEQWDMIVSSIHVCSWHICPFCLSFAWANLEAWLQFYIIFFILPNHKLKWANFNSSLNSRPIQKCKMASSRWRILPQTVGFHLKLFNFKVKTYFVAISRQKPAVFGVVRHLRDITLLIRNGLLILLTVWVTIKGLFIPLLPIYSKVIFLIHPKAAVHCQQKLLQVDILF